MEEHEDLQARLRAMGANPVDPTVAADHLTRMAAMPPRSRIRPKLAIAAGFLAGLLVGGSGLAVAGALPDPMQHVAHQALDPLGVDVPDPERYHGPECGDEVKRNHGAYVRDDHELAKSRCGKPVQAGKPGAEDDEGDEKGPCQGPPPWAGKDNGGMTATEKAAAQAAREEACGEAADDAEARDSADDESTTDDSLPAEETTTTTTTAPTTTTTTTVDHSTTTTTVGGDGDTDAGGS